MTPVLMSRRLTLAVSMLALVGGLSSGAQSAQATDARAPVAVAAPVVGFFAEPAAAMPLPPEVAARAFILQDMGSRQTLAARNADVAVEPASMTKLMTAYMVLQAVQEGKLRLDQPLVISDRAWRTGMTGASRSFLEVGSKVRVDELLKGMLVQNGNDAAVALAEGVAGSVDAFVGMMNRQAQVMGLKATHFLNPEGLSARGHVSTARELSLIAARLMTDFPQVMGYVSLKEYSHNGYRQVSRNLLLFRDPSVDGLMTGYTEAAGYGLIATARRTLQGSERRLLSVVVGAVSPEARANESQKLLNWGYSAFDVVKLFDANQSVTTAQVWKGQASSVRLGRPTPLLVVVPRGQAGAIQTSLTRKDPLLAPLTQGQPVGMLTIKVGTQTWQTVPLQTLEAVPSAGWLGRAWDAIRLGIK
ncbi:MAG TPA: D-alanyl-D-alanine carboxypeptidase family protein [Aquabacterium sp.]|uniref:D-alanyl-D-alanine carboxypeptidase family protein n=1 Tax=Aquabacterium sp. TaxID=1872578 RepID=UPI002E333083|nr:D-alanyl-D-alanine carboxypeptidase family protein [Aquabacterium sp.]HEX5355631.1 D-alanyl-D-alanine carboxypeptidase family protein [Aquabacterium sp.]